MASPDIFILGAGMVGLCLADACQRRNLNVLVCDPDRIEHSASWAAAGMLAPVAEWLDHGNGDIELLDGWIDASEVWADISDRLGDEIGYSAGPSLCLVTGPDTASGLRPDLLRVPDKVPEGLRTHEFCAFELPCDGQVDNRRAISVLRRSLQDRGVIFDTAFDPAPGAWVLQAIGWKADDVAPVKGQALSIQRRDNHPETVVRFPGGYIVPKADRTLVGATSEPGVNNLSVEDETIEKLRQRAVHFWPSVSDGAEIERWAGIRPRALGGRPVIRSLARRRLQIGGHHRNGILLAPFTAECVAARICGETLPVAAEHVFDLDTTIEDLGV